MKSAPFFSILFLLIACSASTDKDQKNATPHPAIRAEAYVVIPQQFSSVYSTNGTIIPNEEIEIRPEVAGRITKINFREGSYVRRGQMLVQLYDADVRAAITKLKAQKALQQKMLGRQKELVNIGGISQQDYESTTTLIQGIDADISIQEAELRKMQIIAPFNGKIGIRNISEGAIVSTTTVIATLQQTNPLKMDFTIPDNYRDIIQPGKVVYFSVNESSDTMQAQVKAISPGADANTRTLNVRVVIPNPDEKLIAGSFAHVSIPFDSKVDALLIPSSAIIPTSRDKEVAVVKNGKVTMKTVILGSRTSDNVEITSGLNAGDTVLTTALMKLKEGAEVEVIKIVE